MFIRTGECLPDVQRLIRQQNAMAVNGPKQMSHKEVEELSETLVLKYSNNFVKDTTKVCVEYWLFEVFQSSILTLVILL